MTAADKAGEDKGLAPAPLKKKLSDCMWGMHQEGKHGGTLPS
jgi:hypothetical protein